MKCYICQEHGDLFWIEAKTPEDAEQKAALYNATVVREANEDEIFEMCIEDHES